MSTGCPVILTHHFYEKHNKKPEFTMANFIMTILAVFVAGTETMTTTLTYGLLLLLKYPEITAKSKEEIEHVIGRHRSPSMLDRSNMPYMDALIHEIQRYIYIVPKSRPHAATHNIKFREYLIPKSGKKSMCWRGLGPYGVVYISDYYFTAFYLKPLVDPEDIDATSVLNGVGSVLPFYKPHFIPV
ncbi:cytochrome P450 2C21-like [Sorex araneus]|uniref:cytochrome P450 2C21-like n=1 Tax=Sorex araneus TaxID=42254 RepID=UPI0024338872|nr:cytochrome P450 2C21-like [Sorex araneus]